MAQAPIPFASPIPVARAKLQDFRRFVGQTIDKNEAQKQRLTELKSLKSIAQAYGISKAAAESLSYDDLNAFVKRMEVERANETLQEQQALRQAQMAQALAARQTALNQDRRAEAAEGRAVKTFEEQERQRSGMEEFLSRAMPTPTPAQTQRREQAPGLAAEVGDFKPPPIMEASPEDFLRRMQGLENPYAKQAAHGEYVRKKKAQQEADMAGLDAFYKGREYMRTEEEAGRAKTSFSQEQALKTFDGIRLENELVKGVIGDKADAIKTKKAIADYNSMIGLINKLQVFADQREKEWWMGAADKAEAEALARQVQAFMREDVLGPGTVTDAERAILENIIVNPTKFWSFSKGKTGKQRLEELKIQLRSKFRENLQNKGLKFGGASTTPGASPPQTPQVSIPGITIESVEDI